MLIVLPKDGHFSEQKKNNKKSRRRRSRRIHHDPRVLVFSKDLGK